MMSGSRHHGSTGNHSNQPQSLTGTVAELSSSKPNRVQKALVLIRTRFLKEKDGIARLRHRGGLPKLVQLLRGDNGKLIDITLSILGNCCMEQKTRQEILNLEGSIETIGKLLEKTEVSSIHNRTCRTLANLALDPQCCDAVHQVEDPEVVSKVVKLLKGSTDVECQQTYLRTLRLLADTTEHETAVVEEGGLKAATELLKSEDMTVILASLKAVDHFTKEVTEAHCIQLVGADFASALLELSTHSDTSVSHGAISMVLTLVRHELLRPPFGAAGAIPFFLEKAQESASPSSQRFSYVNALCLCCRESVNRIRIRDTGTLVQMLEWLNETEFGPIHNRIISSLVCFLYDEAGMSIMLKNSVVPTLVRHLRKCANIPETCAVMASPVTDQPVEGKEAANEEEPMVIPASAEDPLQLDADCSAGKWDKGLRREDMQEPANTPCEGTKAGETSEASDDKPQVSGQPEFVSAAKEEISEGDKVQETASKRGPVKYSIDSPTYKEMMESHQRDDEDYQSGPRNIMESAQYYGPHGQYSPGKLSPYQSPHHGGSYSPMSVSSYLGSDWSPEVSPAASPVRCQSPVLSFSSSQDSCSQGPFSNAEGAALSLPQWSPTHGSSPSASQWSNVSYSSPMSSPPHPQMSPLFTKSHSSPSLWSPLHVTYDPHFSSSEEDGSEEETVTFQVGDSDLLQAPGLDEDVFPAGTALFDDPEPQPSTSEVDPSSEATASAGGDNKAGAPGRKRKRSLTAEAQREIRRKVEEHSRTPSTVSLESLLSESKSTKLEKTEGELSGIKGPRKITEYNILVLLSRVSCLDDPSKHMGSKTVWTVLLDYAQKARDPIYRGLRIMVRLAKNPHCLRTLILNCVPELIDRILCAGQDKGMKEAGDQSADVKRSVHNDTRQLRDQLLGSLSIVAESPFGRGTLTNVMMRGSTATQLRCAVSLPFICRSASLRDDVLVSCGALDALLDGLSQKPIEEVPCIGLETIVHSISHLASTCDLTHDQHFTSGSKKSSAKKDWNTDDVDLNVTFQLDDGRQVKGQREVLASRSSVFKAMLQGHYSESSQSEIRIQNVSAEAFQLFLDWIHFGREVEDKERLSLSLLLEALALCDQYLVPDLQQNLSEYICGSVLDAENVVRVVEFSLAHNSTWLARQGLAYMASHPMTIHRRVDTFQDLMSSQHSVCAINELRNILS